MEDDTEKLSDRNEFKPLSQGILHIGVLLHADAFKKSIDFRSFVSDHTDALRREGLCVGRRRM